MDGDDWSIDLRELALQGEVLPAESTDDQPDEGGWIIVGICS